MRAILPDGLRFGQVGAAKFSPENSVKILPLGARKIKFS